MSQTIEEVLTILQKENSTVTRWATSKNKSAIGVWSDELNRFYTVAAATICTPPMWVINPGECLVNGQQIDMGWEPVDHLATEEEEEQDNGCDDCGAKDFRNCTCDHEDTDSLEDRGISLGSYQS